MALNKKTVKLIVEKRINNKIDLAFSAIIGRGIRLKKINGRKKREIVIKSNQIPIKCSLNPKLLKNL